MSEQTPGASRPAPTQEEIEKGKIWAILGYLVCFILPILAARDNKFAMYHQEQIFVLVISVFIGYIISFILTFVVIGAFLFPLVGLAALVFFILGIINAASGKYTPLPLIGKFGEKFNLVK